MHILLTLLWFGSVTRCRLKWLLKLADMNTDSCFIYHYAIIWNQLRQTFHILHVNEWWYNTGVGNWSGAEWSPCTVSAIMARFTDACVGMMTSSNGNIFRVTGHLSMVNSPHKGQWRGALMFSLICAWINSWVNNREAGDFRRHRAHYDVTVMWYLYINALFSLQRQETSHWNQLRLTWHTASGREMKSFWNKSIWNCHYLQNDSACFSSCASRWISSLFPDEPLYFIIIISCSRAISPCALRWYYIDRWYINDGRRER